ncbi:hypothetical protein [Maritimibacter dapengensis]|uniref:Uncharacterized protein n=1 Tax=Maritimibacter dapengensis TaxID=2836868 RepID=A0ABS6SXS1_9RHOB|nr:hypothetical protein [Maritimibacter dapengensis]MBV7377758.1 hypothetical protein [Maritimibacter dapengensis]
MQHDWLIDVLTDLKAFAQANGMGASAAALDDASLVVLAEMTSLARAKGQAGSSMGEHDNQSGSVTYLFAGRGHA